MTPEAGGAARVPRSRAARFSAFSVARQQIDPAIVGLSLTIAPPLHRASELIAAYAEVIGRYSWGVGGAAGSNVRTLVEASGGHVFVGGPDEQRDLLGKLLTAQRFA